MITYMEKTELYPYQRILLIGSPGSGKSTLANQLAKELHLPLIHLDQLNWQDTDTTLDSKEFDQKLNHILAQPAWLIDGHYSRSLEARLKACDCVIWLDFPRLLCVYRVIKRYLVGKTQGVTLGGNPLLLEKDFLKFVWRFKQENTAKITQLQQNYPHLTWFHIQRKKDLPK